MCATCKGSRKVFWLLLLSILVGGQFHHDHVNILPLPLAKGGSSRLPCSLIISPSDQTLIPPPDLKAEPTPHLVRDHIVFNMEYHRCYCPSWVSAQQSARVSPLFLLYGRVHTDGVGGIDLSLEAKLLTSPGIKA